MQSNLVTHRVDSAIANIDRQRIRVIILAICEFVTEILVVALPIQLLRYLEIQPKLKFWVIMGFALRVRYAQNPRSNSVSRA